MKPSDELRSIRERLDITQREVADRVGVSTRTVMRWESGAGAPPRAGVLELARRWLAEANVEKRKR